MSPHTLFASMATAALQEACAEASPVDRLFFNELLLMGADINAPCSGGETPLMKAAVSGALDKVEYLIACGADVLHTHAADGRTAQALAADRGHSQVARRLLTATDRLRSKFEAAQREKPLRLSATATTARPAPQLRVIT